MYAGPIYEKSCNMSKLISVGATAIVAKGPRQIGKPCLSEPVEAWMKEDGDTRPNDFSCPIIRLL